LLRYQEENCALRSELANERATRAESKAKEAQLTFKNNLLQTQVRELCEKLETAQIDSIQRSQKRAALGELEFSNVN
jgi:hypothetical protein